MQIGARHPQKLGAYAPTGIRREESKSYLYGCLRFDEIAPWSLRRFGMVEDSHLKEGGRDLELQTSSGRHFK